jgi:hypothetical protein
MIDPPPLITLEYAEPRAARPAGLRRTVGACRALAALCCAAAWVALVFYERVGVAGAMLFTIGLTFVVAGAVTHDWRAVGIGVAHVAVCGLGVALLRWRGLGPGQLQVSFLVMGALYTLSALCLAAWPPAVRVRAARRRGGRAAGVVRA